MDKGLKRLNSRNAKRKKRMQKRIAIIIVLIIAVIFALFSAFDRGPVSITIDAGAPSTSIAQTLKDNGVIHSKLWFLLRLKLSEYDGKLQYGTFELNKEDSISSIIKTLATNGEKKDTITLTIPEGFSVERIKAKVCDAGLCSEAEFEKALKKDYDYSFLKCVPDSSDIKYKLQGFLFPSTYEFYKDASAEDIITTMLDEFEKQTKSLNIKKDKLYDVITKASMIENEALLDSERPMIAGVIENRLKQNMRLQIDATVVYSITDGMYNVKKVYYKDLENKSKYNTYRYNGLPVGPISCPSLVSIKAALNPKHHNYLYYHTNTEKNDGSHIFTENYEEHKDTQ